MHLSDGVRSHCAAIASAARWIRIDPGAADLAPGVAGLDPGLHLLEAGPQERARYVLVLDAINFGSGWFAELGTGTDAITAALTAHARARGTPWSAAELRALTPADAGAALGLDPGHELTGLYAQALRDLGAWLGDAAALDRIAAAPTADALARALAQGMPFYADAGFYKRAQITVNDLVLADVADLPDVDRLTAFADDLVPHVLRRDGVLVYDDELAAVVDSGTELPHGHPMEVEIRACAIHACELLAERAGVPPRTLDNWLWNRGRSLPPDGRRPHRTRTVFY